jgi:hypothetical protein
MMASKSQLKAVATFLLNYEAQLNNMRLGIKVSIFVFDARRA